MSLQGFMGNCLTLATWAPRTEGINKSTVHYFLTAPVTYETYCLPSHTAHSAYGQNLHCTEICSQRVLSVQLDLSSDLLMTSQPGQVTRSPEVRDYFPHFCYYCRFLTKRFQHSTQNVSFRWSKGQQNINGFDQKSHTY